MKVEPYIEDFGAASAVVVPDWHRYNSMLGTYCGKDKHDGSLRRGADLYILCHSSARADEVLEQLRISPYLVGAEIAIGRWRIYGDLPGDLLSQGHTVACDTRGEDCDDARLKGLYPPPDGPTLDFSWDAGAKVHRLRCLSRRKDGSISSERIVLRDDAEWNARLKKAYARFSRRQPVSGSAMMCHRHVARIISRLDHEAARMLRAWIAKMESIGIDGHQEHVPLTISASSVSDPGDLLHLTLKGVSGSYLLSARCHYHGDTQIADRTLTLRADLPETVAYGLAGKSASCIWGDDDLADVRIKRLLPPSRRKGDDGSEPGSLRLYDLEMDVVELAVPSPSLPDEGEAIGELRSDAFGSLWIEPVVAILMKPLSASQRLHVYRTLKCGKGSQVDISPWLPDVSHPVMLKCDGQHVSYSWSGSYLSSGAIPL